MKKILFLFAFITVGFVNAQDFTGVISSYLNNNRTQLELQPQDIEEFSVDRQSFSKSMNLHNVYIIQKHQGIEIFNSTSSLAIKNTNVVNANLSFVSNLSTKVNTTTPSINAITAITKAANELGVENPSNLSLLESSGNTYLYSNGGISLENIPVKLVYQPTETNKLRLAWDLSIYLLDASHYYSVRVDAVNGSVLSIMDWVISCNFEAGSHNHNTTYTTDASSILFPQSGNNTISSGGNQYRVFGLPFESPNHGPESLIADPADPVASPFGWHDTNGAPGAEFTITRGNNVLAQDDINNNNGTGASPDGGPALNFDFPFDFTTNPVNMLEAATVNLFYWNNIMHDVWYQYGFDEASGSFQENNYGNGGFGSDSVNADAQDGGGTNNANFSTPPDGLNPRMQMYLWSASGPPGQPLTINNGPLAGDYTAVPAGFGAPLPEIPLTADLVLVIDNNAGTSTDPNDACDAITNGGALAGKIAVIRRGGCEFGVKVLAAENAGAVAAIVVNNDASAIFSMGAGAVGGSVTIPSIMVSQADGEAIITQLQIPATVNGTLVATGPYMIDGDLDNGIIAHEYGHGISNRLTGGPNNTNCLGNAEQMGEGWSDWFGLMLTLQTGDQGSDIRGIGTYATGQPTNGGGIREAPYSTDFGINNYTYADTNSGVSQPHGIGFVWGTMLWEMTWDLIDEYGFDSDLYNGTGGNNIAMQLVLDGLKLQSCSPGFVDGRDAILEADLLANGGANRCLIWNAFARRGLGFSANQGSSNSRSDQTEAFDLPVDCELGVNDQGSLDNNFIIYPNPSNGDINIKSVIDAGDALISIYDINGREVYSQNVQFNTTVNIQAKGLTTGIYIIQIDGVNYLHTAKLIIK
jgi:extracellular elastinolytic metalloproteinase